MKIKTNYRKIKPTYEFNPYSGNWEWEDWGVGRYTYTFKTYYRYPKTFNEIKQNAWALDDGYKVRGRRRGRAIPTVWEDQIPSRNWKKSWKDFTKCEKQYMVNL